METLYPIIRRKRRALLVAGSVPVPAVAGLGNIQHPTEQLPVSPAEDWGGDGKTSDEKVSGKKNPR